jgi:ATP-dependent helicase/nuclease subunit A
MTRAEDRLYVYGSEGAKGRKDACWYDLIRMGMIEGLSEHLEIIENDKSQNDDAEHTANPLMGIPDNVTLSYGLTQAVKPHDDGRRPAKDLNAAGIPEWAKTNIAATINPPLPTIRPSQFLNDFNQSAEKSAPSLLQPPKANQNMGTDYGTALHALLEILPKLPPQDQARAARDYVTAEAPHLNQASQDALQKTALALVNNPKFAPLFSSQSRAEVTLRGVVYHHQKAHQFKGQIDRLLISDDKITIVDFKSNSKVPPKLSDIPPAYVMQMALYKAALAEIYPNHKIETALLWTKRQKLQTLPAALLQNILDQNGLSFSADAPLRAAEPPKPVRKSANKSLKNIK